MRSENVYEGMDKRICTVVRVKAVELARRPEFASHEREDLEQELMLEVMLSLSAHDAAKAALKTYVERIVEHKGVRLIQERWAQKRKGLLSNVSLELLLEQMEDEEEALGQSAIDPDPEPQVVIGLRVDLKAALERMPALDRVMFRLLCDYSPAEVARYLDLPRTTVHEAIKRIRKHLLESGLDDSLKKVPSLFSKIVHREG